MNEAIDYVAGFFESKGMRILYRALAVAKICIGN